jgi:excisionase family DNA binding protein
MNRQAISIAQACTLVSVSRRTIYNWIDAGKIEYVRTAGGSIRIFADSLFRTPGMATIAAADRTPHQPSGVTRPDGVVPPA